MPFTFKFLPLINLVVPLVSASVKRLPLNSHCNFKVATFWPFQKLLVLLLINSTPTCFTGSGGGLGIGISGGGTGGATFGIGADDEAFERVEGGGDFFGVAFFRTWCNISLH